MIVFSEAMTIAQFQDILSEFDSDNAITYYKEFRDKVIKGEIPVCEEVSKEMNRIDAILISPMAKDTDIDEVDVCMTLEEIKKKLGYKVKIVSDKET